MRRLSTEQKAELVGDLHIYGGALLLSGGAGWAYPPAGLIVFGVLVTGLGLFMRGPRK